MHLKNLKINSHMAYQRNDENCDPVSPQPGKTTVNQFSGNEGWSTVTYENFNADYQRSFAILTILREHWYIPSKEY